MSRSTIEKHIMQQGRHPLYRVWKRLRDLDLFNEEWATATRCSTSQEQGPTTRASTSHSVGGLLDEGIDVELLVDGFLRRTHILPLHILETKPNKPIAMCGPTTNLDITREVQHACEMVEDVASGHEEVRHEEEHHVP